MTSGWSRFNFRIKHQLYLRILPVVALSVLAVGAFSGRLLTNRAVRTYVEQESLESNGALAGALQSITVQSLLAQVEEQEHLTRLMRESGPGDHAGAVRRFLENLLRHDGLRGAAIVRVSPDGRSRFIACVLDSGLASPANQDSLAAWVGKTWTGLASADWIDLLAHTGWPGGPRIVSVDRLHSLWVFDPLPLRRVANASAEAPLGQAPPPLELVLPAAVHEELLPSPDGASGQHPGQGKMHLVLLLDVSYLLANWFRTVEPGEMQVVLDRNGRLVGASVDSLAPGLDLTALSGAFLGRGNAGELERLLALEAPDGITSGTAGSNLNQHAVLMARRPALPLTLVTTLEMSKINGGLVLYSAIIALMVAIALLGSILVITSIGEKLSNRLQAMAHNMEEVARGDFTRRMGLGTEDEVGRLISYFNQMTADLEEAHQQLSDRTQNLRVALDKMRRLDKAKDDFLALISHEVRTPLTSIIGGIDYMRAVLPAGDTEQGRLLEQLGVTEVVDIVESGGRRLSEFMNDAILMASLQSSDIRFHLRPVPMYDLCGVVLSSLQEGVAAKRLVVENSLADDVPWAPLCDRELMVTAVEKLVRNAVQHNFDDGKVRLREVEEVPGLGTVSEVIDAKARQEFLDQPELVRWHSTGVRWRALEIFNTGPFISKEKREALFAKFELVGRIEHHQKGSGLSLPIVQAIMENHGGKVHVESVADEGNFFYLILPTVATAEAAHVAPSRNEQGQGFGGFARREEADVVADPAAREVELQHLSP